MTWTLTATDGQALRAAVKVLCGITVPPDKDYLLVSRLEPVALAARLTTPLALARALGEPAQRDLRKAAVAAITTHETSFFRDGHPWETLRTVLPAVFQATRAAGRRPRAWSAACSTGQEPYTLAMLLAELPPSAGEAPELVATDVCERTVQTAAEGIFTDLEIRRGLSDARRSRFFIQQPDRRWQAVPALRSPLVFRRHNLLDRPVLLGRFDLIVLRNVLIYFDKTARTTILHAVRSALQPGGILLVGASESLSGDGLDLVARHQGSTAWYQAP